MSTSAVTVATPRAWTADRPLAPHRDPHTVAVLVFDGAPLFETSTAIGVFGVDRTADGAPPFRLLAVAADGGPATTTGGIRLEAPHGLAAAAGAGVVVVPSWRGVDEPPPPAVLDALRTAHAEGALLVSLCLGAFVLAATGIADGRRLATNWSCAAALAERHPTVAVEQAALFVDEGDYVASAGTAAGLDACLHVVRRGWGAQAATAIARRMVVPPLRDGGQAQFIERPMPDPDDDRIGAVTAHLLEHLAEPADVARLAALFRTSRRTLDRRFRAATGTSVTHWLLAQRVLHARRLLEATDLPVEEVARRSGFGSAVGLRPHFRAATGTSPSRYRAQFTQLGAG